MNTSEEDISDTIIYNVVSIFKVRNLNTTALLPSNINLNTLDNKDFKYCHLKNITFYEVRLCSLVTLSF